MTDKMKKAFVFGGGSSLGSIEVGMLKALVERDVIPDFVVGTSACSSNGISLIAMSWSREIKSCSHRQNLILAMTKKME